MYKEVLIPTDGSALSGHAVTHGVALAKTTGARVTGLFVAPAPTPVVFEGMVPVALMQPDEHAALTARAAARYLGVIEKAAKQAGVAYEGVTVTDEFPAETILKTAAQHKCDLIVMASHGRRGLAGVLLGSETQKVLTHSKLPVLVCR
jgi:nucleotide-binding universal stress UspA family protein